MLYQAYQLQSDWMSPLRLFTRWGSSALSGHRAHGSKQAAAAMEVFSRMRLTHKRPSFGILTSDCAGTRVAIEEEVLLSMPFGSLLHFKKVGADAPADQAPVLLVAPLSGHFATLLR